MSTTLPEPGALVAEKYRIEESLGQGGMGAVFAATHAVTGKRVALKWMLPEFATDAQSSARFLREAQAAARIDHPNVIDVYDVGQHEGALFLVMEMLKGETLSARAAQGPLTIADAVALLLPALRGLAAAHRQGIVHRDLKPDNIFLAQVEDGAPPVPKVLDFGISKLGQGLSLDPNSQLTRTGTVMGTPHYMAPEQLRGAKDVDARADLYSMGVVLYQLLTGKLPHDADSYGELVFKVNSEPPTPLSQLRPELDAALCAVVERCLARNVDDRHGNAEALIADLTPFAPAASIPPGGPASTASPAAAMAQTPATHHAPSTPPQRPGWFASLLLAGVLMAIAAIVVGSYFLWEILSRGPEPIAQVPDPPRHAAPPPAVPTRSPQPGLPAPAVADAAVMVEQDAGKAPARRARRDKAPKERRRLERGDRSPARATRDAPGPSDAREERQRPAPRTAPPPRTPGPKPSGPVLSKDEATRVLEPKVLQCMKRAGVHYVITRVGQGYKVSDKGPLAPIGVLGDPEPNYVDYRRVRGFERTPLGRCIDRAARRVRVRAFRGNYIYLGIRNPSTPDPLAGLARQVDQKAAKAALSERDGHARECVRRHPDEATEGKVVSMLVHFTGHDGKVQKVEPYYMDQRSAFTRCIVGAYSSTRVSRFRGLSDKVLHKVQL